MSAWIARHVHALLSSAGHLARRPFATALTVLLMGVALALPLALNELVRNVRAVSQDFAGAIGLSVYFKAGVSEERARQLARAAQGRSGVAEATLTTAAEALKQFRQQSGFAEALDALEANPLPHRLTVRPRSDAAPADVENLKRYLASWPEVDSVQLDSEWVARFTAWVELLRRVLQIAAGLLGLGVLAVIGHTTRMEILNRRAEIQVTKLVGGTNAFVRRPFLYTGALYGLLAGLLGWLLVSSAIGLLAQAVQRLASTYGSRFALAGPSWSELGWLTLAGFLLGWCGAWVAATQELSRIEPGAP